MCGAGAAQAPVAEGGPVGFSDGAAPAPTIDSHIIYYVRNSFVGFPS